VHFSKHMVPFASFSSILKENPWPEAALTFGRARLWPNAGYEEVKFASPISARQKGTHRKVPRGRPLLWLARGPRGTSSNTAIPQAKANPCRSSPVWGRPPWGDHILNLESRSRSAPVGRAKASTPSGGIRELTAGLTWPFFEVIHEGPSPQGLMRLRDSHHSSSPRSLAIIGAHPR